MSFGHSGQSAAEIYSDIIDLPHHEPKTRMRMPRSNRAASFSPFAALSGYDDAVGVYDSDRENYAGYGGEHRTGKKSEGCQQRVFPVRTRKKESIIIRFVPSEEKLLEHSAVPYRFVR